MINVKVIRIPGFVKPVLLSDNATIADALQAAEVTLGTNEACTLNGTSAGVHEQLREGDRIVLAVGAKGNK